jgi:hypothetical protein
MNRFDLSDNFINDPEALIRRPRAKLKRVQSSTSSSQLKDASDPEDTQTVFQSLTPEFDTMANKSLCEFLAPTTDNI